MRKPIIALDMDEVVADLIGGWLRLFNEKVGTNHRPEDVTEWDMAKTVGEAHRGICYLLLSHPDLYRYYVRPIEGALDATSALRERGRVIFVTACTPGTEEAKYRWLNTHGFIQSSKDFCPLQDKSLIRADILFDDRPENVSSFPGIGILVNQPHNRLADGFARIRHLKDAPPLVDRLISQRMVIPGLLCH